MADLLRQAPLGQILRYVTGNRILQYPEELPGFRLPACYNQDHAEARRGSTAGRPIPGEKAAQREAGLALWTIDSDESSAAGLEKVVTARDRRPDHIPILDRISTRHDLEKVTTRAELQLAYSQATQQPGPCRPVVPERLADGTILVDFYATDDPANPQNWSQGKKAFVTLQICLYTFTVYIGSAIYVPSELGVMQKFGVSSTVAALGLSLYVLACEWLALLSARVYFDGIGPLIFSPLSEIPSVGRNPPYIITFAIFVVLCVPTALVNNLAGLLVLRFLQGFFGSPALSTGGASLQDLYSLIKVPYALCAWELFITCGPALGPIVSGYSVPVKNWRWSLWEMLWIAGPVFLLLFLCLPETSTPNILLRRARRLRKLTGDDRLQSQSEIDQALLSVREIVIEALWAPLQIIFLDPSIAFADLYIALCYAIFYSFFESFPIVFGPGAAGYGFNVGETGLAFLSVTAGVVTSLSIYIAYLWFVVEPGIRRHGLRAPESRLIPALFASVLLPVGLFLFGWTARPSIHWLVPLIGVALVSGVISILFQAIFVYLPLSYPARAASIFAGNDFVRSVFAAAAILYAGPLYRRLNVGPGCSLLAGLTAACVAGIFALYFYGARLRARSRFAAK
ncbi:MAG: hypothetical protein M1826_006086 [Phylliscum demangeonii]|nr:MAG: hypothetical protein M1826_006086 [Phylliscum demangeonii]